MIQSTLHKAWFSLTVSESKRLIALGIKNSPSIVDCLRNGTLIITKGTTNTYVAETLTGTKLANGDYVNGYILPNKSVKTLNKTQVRKEFVLEKGIVSDKTFPEILDFMTDEDIILKGANMINYAKGQAGVIIGHPTGGTCGAMETPVNQNGIRVIIPVGLEKDSSVDIEALSQTSKNAKNTTEGNSPYLWHLKGELFTEIEALKTFSDVEVKFICKGGIGGAEGSVSFLIIGNKKNIETTLKLIESIQGEKTYIS